MANDRIDARELVMLSGRAQGYGYLISSYYTENACGVFRPGQQGLTYKFRRYAGFIDLIQVQIS